MRRLAVVPALRWVLWSLLAVMVLVLVTGLPEWTLDRVADGRLPRGVLLLPALVFGLFVVAFGTYRFLLVKAGRYNAGKAFVQVGLGALVLTLLFPANLARYREVAPEPPVALGPLLDAEDPAIRAVACEALAARRGPDAARDRARVLAESDPDPRVRAACRRVR
jgi:hypothetical protein